jgi:hypothetical protein
MKRLIIYLLNVLYFLAYGIEYVVISTILLVVIQLVTYGTWMLEYFLIKNSIVCALIRGVVIWTI